MQDDNNTETRTKVTTETNPASVGINAATAETELPSTETTTEETQ